MKDAIQNFFKPLVPAVPEPETSTSLLHDYEHADGPQRTALLGFKAGAALCFIFKREQRQDGPFHLVGMADASGETVFVGKWEDDLTDGYQRLWLEVMPTRAREDDVRSKEAANAVAWHTEHVCKTGQCPGYLRGAEEAAEKQRIMARLDVTSSDAERSALQAKALMLTAHQDGRPPDVKSVLAHLVDAAQSLAVDPVRYALDDRISGSFAAAEKAAIDGDAIAAVKHVIDAWLLFRADHT